MSEGRNRDVMENDPIILNELSGSKKQRWESGLSHNKKFRSFVLLQLGVK
jgi:hypothetical protein